jgi:uncharacterized membrane protein
MNLQKDLSELIQAGILSDSKASEIRTFYRNKKNNSPNKLLMVFGVLGATLIGMGIILILAHNWDELARSTKTTLAFLPLIIGQIACGFTLLKKPESQTWRESSSVFLFFAIGASISLVGQIYNIPGNLASFLLVWALLSLPLVYIMKSSMISILYLAGITWYACEVGYWGVFWRKRPFANYYYWGLLLLIVPYYYSLIKNSPKSNALTFLHWIVPISIVIAFGTTSKGNGYFTTLAYFCLFNFFYLLGNLPAFSLESRLGNGYIKIGSIGMIFMLFGLSFSDSWSELTRDESYFENIFQANTFWASIALIVSCGVLFFRKIQQQGIREIKPKEPTFLLIAIFFLVGLGFSTIPVVLVNIFILGLGIITTKMGADREDLPSMNYGMLIISALIICRFLDSDLDFVIRGIGFILLGAGFFATNYWMMKRKKKDDLHELPK